MTGFDDSTIAARMRDLTTRLVIRTLDQERPPYKYATVKQIDPDLKSCKVWYPGDGSESDSANWSTVKIGGIVPASAGVVVRVAGRLGDKYIADVMGAARTQDVSATELTAPANFDMSPGIGIVVATWDQTSGADRYRVEFADDAAFTVLVRTFTTLGTAFQLGNLEPNVPVYGRVQAVNSFGAGGPWSVIDSATPLPFPEPALSDGFPPTSSPQPVVSGGLGMLIAEWVPVSNPDLVTYDVYIGTVSGFTPGPTNFHGETTGTFYTFATDAAGADLVPETPYYVRLIARDKDGSAAAGAQGMGQTKLLELGDVGNVPSSAFHDGTIPAASPDAPSITSGIGYLYVKWTHVSNPDAVTYEVHVSSTDNFTPNANSLVGETPSNFTFIRRQGPGALNAPFVYGTTYYVKIWAKDADGYSQNPGTQSSGFTLKAGTVDISEGAITAESAILADLAVGSAKIVDAAITTAKIADLSVNEAKINDLAVTTAKIANLAVNTAKIGDLQVTSAKISSLSADKITAGTIVSQAIYLNGVSSLIGSSNYTAGSAGWLIRGDGYAELNNITVRGTVVSDSFQTAASGARVRMGSALTAADEVQFIGPGGNSASLRHGQFVSGNATSMRLSAGGIIDVFFGAGISPDNNVGNRVAITAATGIRLAGPTTVVGALSATSVSAVDMNINNAPVATQSWVSSRGYYGQNSSPYFNQVNTWNTYQIGQFGYLQYYSPYNPPPSDIALKENITYVDWDALADVMLLHTREFEWIYSGKRERGFIAQEMPDYLFAYSEDGTAHIPNGAFFATLVKAVQQQQAQIQALQAQIAPA